MIPPRPSAMAWRRLHSLVALPVLVMGAIPAGLLLLERRAGPAVLRSPAFAAGVVLVAAGLALTLWTVALLVMDGRGSSTWPPAALVVRGPYRHVRNPMILAGALVIAGEALALHSRAIGLWAAVFCLLHTVWFPRVEEPALEARFGEAYRAYRARVPRWVPGWIPRWGAGRGG